MFTDKNYGNQNSDEGPKSERKTTDIACCLIFLLFWGATGYLGVSWKNSGDLTRVMRPYDGMNKCGIENAKNYPYLFFNIKNIQSPDIMKSAVCVKDCPKDDKVTFKPTDCVTGHNVNTCSQLKSYETAALFNRFCIPTDTKMFAAVTKTFSVFSLDTVIESVLETKKLIIGSIIVAFLLSFLFSFFLNYCAGVVVTFSLIGFYVAAGYGGYLSYKGYHKYSDTGSELEQKKFKLLKGLFVGICSFVSVMSIVLCCYFSRIVLATKIISAAAEFVGEVKRVVFVPILMLIITSIYLGFWTLMTCYLYSNGDLKFNESKPYGVLSITKQQKNYLLFHGFGLLWNLAFLLTASNFIITGIAALWYYRKHKTEGSLVMRVMWWMMRYHLGTIAFGSLLLALVWVLRILAESLEKEAKKSKSDMKKFIACCVKCCLSCLEKIIKFMNQHAFVQVILKSENFCTSAISAAGLVARNFIRFSVLHGLGAIIMWFAKLFIVSICLIFSYFTLTRIYGAQLNGVNDLKYHGAPLVIIGVFSFSIASLFAHIWSTGSDVILHCYCVDEQSQSQYGAKKAQYASEKMHNVIEETHEKFGDAKDDSYEAYL